MRDFFRKWWEGEYVPYENKPNSPIVFIGGDYERHWTVNKHRSGTPSSVKSNLLI